MTRVVLVHGGAGHVRRARREGAMAGCLAAARAGWQVLAAGGDALDAAVEAVAALEDDERFNAGRGAVLTRAGTVELDAAVMRGSDRAAGAAACVTRTRNPVRLARALLDTDALFLAGEGADAFSRERGLVQAEPAYFVTEARRAQLAAHLSGAAASRMGTVGAVALDAGGVLAAATSTGGRVGKPPGRVGDTPVIGAGTYADREGAASCTGDGEFFIRALAAFTAVAAIARAGPQAAARLALDRVAAVGGTGGVILLAPSGEVGIAWTTATMPHAWVRDGAEGTAL